MADIIAQHPGITITQLPPAPMWVLHADPSDAVALGAAMERLLPAELLRAVGEPEGAALHLAPDEWVLLGGDPGARLATCGIDHSLVDVSDRSCAAGLSGPLAAAVLAAGCPIDTADATFPVGACTRTLFGKADVTLWRQTDRFRLDYGRSFAPYVTGLLRQAAMDALA